MKVKIIEGENTNLLETNINIFLEFCQLNNYTVTDIKFNSTSYLNTVKNSIYIINTVVIVYRDKIN